MHIINRRTVEILGPLRLQSTNQKESRGKKARVFPFFNQGKRPGDPEVKTLGIKPNTVCRYYQAWKEAHTSSNPTAITVINHSRTVIVNFAYSPVLLTWF